MVFFQIWCDSIGSSMGLKSINHGDRGDIIELMSQRKLGARMMETHRENEPRRWVAKPKSAWCLVGWKIYVLSHMTWYIYISYIYYIYYIYINIYIYTVYTFGETKPSHLHLPEWADTSKYHWISEVRAPKKDMDATTTIRDSNIWIVHDKKDKKLGERNHRNHTQSFFYCGPMLM